MEIPTKIITVMDDMMPEDVGATVIQLIEEHFDFKNKEKDSWNDDDWNLHNTYRLH